MTLPRRQFLPVGGVLLSVIARSQGGNPSTRPVRVIVPFAPEGGDALARLIARSFQ